MEKSEFVLCSNIHSVVVFVPIRVCLCVRACMHDSHPTSKS